MTQKRCCAACWGWCFMWRLYLSIASTAKGPSWNYLLYIVGCDITRGLHHICSQMFPFRLILDPKNKDIIPKNKDRIYHAIAKKMTTPSEKNSKKEIKTLPATPLTTPRSIQPRYHPGLRDAILQHDGGFARQLIRKLMGNLQERRCYSEKKMHDTVDMDVDFSEPSFDWGWRTWFWWMKLVIGVVYSFFVWLVLGTFHIKKALKFQLGWLLSTNFHPGFWGHKSKTKIMSQILWRYPGTPSHTDQGGDKDIQVWWKDSDPWKWSLVKYIPLQPRLKFWSCLKIVWVLGAEVWS